MHSQPMPLHRGTDRRRSSKANAYHFTDSTVQVLNTRKNDGSVLYEMELYDGRQSMSEQNKEVPDMNEWERLHRQAQRYKEAYPPGTRIMLLGMGNDPNPVESGTRGTVRVKSLAPFHNEGHHPHVHLMVYSTNRSEGFLSKSGIDKLRSSIAREIFHQDLISVYEKQTEHRNALRTQRRDMISEIVSRINSGTYDNPALENKLLDLADRLSKTSGKKQYGYLKADVKAIVNGIVSDLAADERIASLYDLWYEQREEVIRTYTEELPERIPLVDNSEFKSIKNVVIQEALNISADRLIADEQDEQAEVKAETSEPEADEVEEQEYAPAPRSVQRSRMWQLYRNAKELLDRESDAYDPNTAVNLLIEAAFSLARRCRIW